IGPYSQIERERRRPRQRDRLVLVPTLAVRRDHRQGDRPARSETGGGAGDDDDPRAGAHRPPIILWAWRATASLSSKSMRSARASSSDQTIHPRSSTSG